MFCVWAVCSYVKEPELFPAGSWPIHNIPIVLHFVLLLGMVNLGSTIIDSNVNVRNKKIRGTVAMMAITIQTVLLYAPNIFADAGGGITIYMHM